MMDRPLSGSDYFHLLLDRKMLRNGLVGNISRIHLELSPSADPTAIEAQLRSNKTLRTVSQLQVKLQWPLLPVWKVNDGHDINLTVTNDLSEDVFQKLVLNRKVNNQNGLVLVDLCALTDGTKHVVISMHHVLFDHQGMMNFVRALSDGSIDFPLFPEKERLSWFTRFRNTVSMTFYMLSRSSWKLGSLINKHTKPKASPKFKIIEFDQETTEHVEKNAWNTGASVRVRSTLHPLRRSYREFFFNGIRNRPICGFPFHMIKDGKGQAVIWFPISFRSSFSNSSQHNLRAFPRLFRLLTPN